MAITNARFELSLNELVALQQSAVTDALAQAWTEGWRPTAIEVTHDRTAKVFRVQIITVPRLPSDQQPTLQALSMMVSFL